MEAYKQISDRIMYVKIKVANGVAGFVNAYAPHNGLPLPDRLSFYSNLDSTVRACSANAGKFVVGDLNARIGIQKPGEDHLIGPHSFGREALHQVELPNLALLLEFCEDNSFVVANTFQDIDVTRKITFMDHGSWSDSVWCGHF